MATARRAKLYGANVCIVDKRRGEGRGVNEGLLGGTCVNVGCVPKKVMWNAGMISEMIKAAPMYNFEAMTPKLDWGALKATRDKYVTRLNGIYTRNMDNAGVEVITGAAEFVGEKTVKVGDETVTADHIVIAVGGMPSPLDIPGGELAINSDGFFALEKQPKKVAKFKQWYLKT